MQSVPQIVRLKFESIENLRSGIANADLNSVQIKPGSLTGGMLFVSTGNTLFSVGHLDGDVRTRGIVDPDRVTLAINLSTNASIFSFISGRHVLPGEIYVMEPGGPFDNRTAGNLLYATLSISRDEMDKLSIYNSIHPNTKLWQTRRWYSAPADLRGFICKSITGIISQLLPGQVNLSLHQYGQFEQSIIELFFQGIVFDDQQRSERSLSSNAGIVRKAEDWIEGQNLTSVNISDLCKAICISRRTLHRAFNETLGLGPMHYIMLKRLSAVRAILRSADPLTTSITNVAWDYGFWELGRFAVFYKRMFGERPSETLKGKRVI